MPKLELKNSPLLMSVITHGLVLMETALLVELTVEIKKQELKFGMPKLVFKNSI